MHECHHHHSSRRVDASDVGARSRTRGKTRGATRVRRPRGGGRERARGEAVRGDFVVDCNQRRMRCVGNSARAARAWARCERERVGVDA